MKGILDTITIGFYYFIGTKILDKERKETIDIIGSGIAGLSAGYILKNNNINSVIFEASDFPGGRTQTVFINNDLDEIGGKEISDGGDALYLRRLTHKLGVPIIDREKPHTIKYYINGEKGSFYEYVDFFGRLKKKNAITFHTIKNLIKDHPILYSSLNTRIQCYEGGDGNELSDLAYTNAVNKIMTTTLKNAPDKKSDLPGMRKSSEFKNGTRDFIQKLSKGQKISYGYELVKISKHGSQYDLLFSNGKRRISKTIVLALPLSKLKEIVKESNIFEPHFKEDLKSIEMGNNTKIIIPIIETTDDFEFGVFSRYITWFNRRKTALTLYFGGTNADVMIDREVIQIKKDLTEIYPMSKFNWDTNTWKIKKWKESHLYRGSYSFPSKNNPEIYEKTVRLNNVHIRNMFRPQSGSLYFVGEHVSVESPGTMEGAVESSVKMMTLLQN